MDELFSYVRTCEVANSHRRRRTPRTNGTLPAPDRWPPDTPVSNGYFKNGRLIMEDRLQPDTPLPTVTPRAEADVDYLRQTATGYTIVTGYTTANGCTIVTGYTTANGYTRSGSGC